MKAWLIFLCIAFAAADAHGASQFFPLGDLPGGQFASFASAISDDGEVVVGRGSRLPGEASDAFYWTQSTGIVNLLTLPPFKTPLTGAAGVSRDRIIVGTREFSVHLDPYVISEAFQWTAANGFQGLGYLPGGERESSGATDVSSDGRVIVGTSDSPHGRNEAYRWTHETGMVGLGDLQGGDFFSIASAISANADFIVPLWDIKTLAFRRSLPVSCVDGPLPSHLAHTF